MEEVRERINECRQDKKEKDRKYFEAKDLYKKAISDQLQTDKICEQFKKMDYLRLFW